MSESNTQSNPAYSEDLLLGILNTSIGGLQVFSSIYDENNNIIDFEWVLVNDAILKTWNKTREDLKGQTLLSLFPGAKSNGIFDNYIKAAKGEAVTFNTYYNQEGLDHWFRLNAIPFRNGFILSSEDITAQVKAEEALKKSNAELEEKVNERTLEIERQRDHIYSVLMQAPAMIAISRGPEFIYELANPIFLKVTGKDESIIGKPLLQAFPELKGQPILDILENVYNKGERFLGMEWPVSLDTNNDGIPEQLNFNFVYEPFRDVNGKVEGVITHAVDVTSQVKIRKVIEDSQQQLTAIFNQTNVGIAQTDLAGKFTMVNEGFCRIVKRPKEELYKMTLFDITHPDDMRREQLGRVAAYGDAYSFEKRYIRPDQDIVWVSMHVTAIKDESGKPVSMIGIAYDITEQKKYEEAIRESEARFRDLADTAPMYMAMADETGSAVYFNQPWLNWTGKTMNEMRGLGWLCTLHPEDAPKFENDFKNAFQNHIPIREEYRFRRNDGEFRWMLAVGAPRFTPEGRFVGYFGTYTDFHDLKQAQEQSHLLMKKKDEFMAVASHELKTPITTVKASLQLLQRLTEEMNLPMIQTHIARSNKQVDKLNSLVSDLLDVSKIHAGKMVFSIQEFSAGEIIEDCIAFISSFGTHKVIVHGNTAFKIKADKSRLEQALCNLLSNGIKYSPDADYIILEVKHDDKVVDFTITDYGVGIDDEKLPYIFDRFFRVKENSMKFPGLGIGLYIAKEIVERHGGNISVESEVNKGTSFTVSMPCNASYYLEKGNED